MSTATTETYDDDRPGMIRLHIAEQRARELCDTYDRDTLRGIARQRGVPTGFPHKRDLALALALHGVKAEDFGGLLLLLDKHPAAANLGDSPKVKAAIVRDGLDHDGEIDPNRVRRALADTPLFHKSIGPAYYALRRGGYIERAGLTVSDDSKGRNAGRPIYRYRLTEKGRAWKTAS